MALDIKPTVATAKIVTDNTKKRPSLWSRLNNKKVGTNDLLFFTEQLALLLETGGSLHASLQALNKQAQNPNMIRILDALLADISEGKSFSVALSRHPNMFDNTYVNLIAASESGGFMHEVLNELLEMESRRQHLRSTIVSAISYPAFLLIFSISVVVFVLAIVFPKFAELFESIKDQLPFTTIVLMLMSDIVRGYWPILITGMVAIILGIKYWISTTAGIETVDRLKLRIPLIKEIYAQVYLVQSLRVMSMSLRNGVSVVDTLEACKEVVSNRLYQAFINNTQKLVQEGKGIAVGFTQSEFIPSIAQHMVTTGEETGNLAKVMGRVADFYERELEKRLTTLSKIAEPLMLMIMGLVVGILVSSLILPIFKLSRAVG